MKMLERRCLTRRGWTEALMRDFLPKPDDYRETQDARLHAAHLWKEDTIIRVECDRAFSAALKRSMDRRGIGTCESSHALPAASQRLQRLAAKWSPPLVIIELYALLTDAELRWEVECRDDGLARTEHRKRRLARVFANYQQVQFMHVHGVTPAEIEETFDKVVSSGKAKKERDQ